MLPTILHGSVEMNLLPTSPKIKVVGTVLKTGANQAKTYTVSWVIMNNCECK